MGILELKSAAIDLRLTSEGEYVFLEVDPSGQFLFCEILTGTAIARSVANLLVAERPKGTTALFPR